MASLDIFGLFDRLIHLTNNYVTNIPIIEEPRMIVSFDNIDYLRNYKVDDANLLLTEDGSIPLIHWPLKPNFGDQLSPWLFNKMTGKAIAQNKGEIASYIAIGSILNRVRDTCTVWGTGSFGPEQWGEINTRATYCAVRGPLTRARLLDRKVDCPRIYGDPALLTPLFFKEEEIEKTHEIGIVLRWSEPNWLKQSVGPGVRIIDLGTNNVERILAEMNSCKRIITSSLHGLIIADAFGIPNAWLSSGSPKGGEFKFYDYFLSVNKIRHATKFDLCANKLSVEMLDLAFQYDNREIEFDIRSLLDSCPLLLNRNSTPISP